MEFKDYYETLGLERSATQPEVKRAYKKLARKYHPDVSSEADAEAKFKQVGEAYEVLKDPEKRAAYDQLGANWQQGQDFNPPPDWDAGFEFSGGGFTGGDASAYSDFFEQMFGRGYQTAGGFGAGSPSNMHGQDHHAKVLIDLEDSFEGTTRSISLQRPSVDAQGRVVSKPHNLNVRIPKGVKAGQQIRLAGQGEQGYGSGKAGDLYLEIEFRPHRLYQVDGRDLSIKLPIAPWEAALGARIKVPTPTGPVEMKIPANASAGKRLRLKGKGIPGKPAGDLFVELNLVTPKADSDQQRALYEKMQQTFDFNPRAALEA